MKWKTYINQTRTNEERRVRYCFLRQIGFGWKASRALSSWKDENVVKFIENLNNLHFKGVLNENNWI